MLYESAIKVLMIDDDIDNYDSLKNILPQYGILLYYSSNLTDGIQILKESKEIAAVILDGKGFINSDQLRGSDKEDFVHEALTQLTLLEKQQDRYIPKCVLTAWYDQLKDSLESRVRIFDKKKLANDDESLKQMIVYLKKEVEDTDIIKIRKKYSDVFRITKLNDVQDKKIKIDTMIFSLLQKTETVHIEQNDFNLARTLLESILLNLSNDNSQFIPKNLIKPGGLPNLTYCVRYIKGLEITEGPNENKRALHLKNSGEKRTPDHIAYSFEFVKEISSSFSHIQMGQWRHYGYNSMVMALCEIIFWYGKKINID